MKKPSSIGKPISAPKIQRLKSKKSGSKGRVTLNPIYLSIYTDTCVYIYIYVYVCICRERERERERDLYTHIYVYMYIYIYIERGRWGEVVRAWPAPVESAVISLVEDILTSPVILSVTVILGHQNPAPLRSLDYGSYTRTIVQMEHWFFGECYLQEGLT